MDDSGFPRTPDRPVKLLGTRVRYQRSVETTIDARGPDFLGGSAIESFGMSSLVLIGALRCIRKWNCLLVTTSFCEINNVNVILSRYYGCMTLMVL